MFCSKCGTQLNDGAMFCPNCGARIASEQAAPVAPTPVQTAPEPVAPAPVVEPTPVQVAPAPVVAPTPVQAAPTPVAPAPVKKGMSTGAAVVIGALIGLVIVGIAAAVVLFVL